MTVVALKNGDGRIALLISSTRGASGGPGPAVQLPPWPLADFINDDGDLNRLLPRWR